MTFSPHSKSAKVAPSKAPQIELFAPTDARLNGLAERDLHEFSTYYDERSGQIGQTIDLCNAWVNGQIR